MTTIQSWVPYTISNGNETPAVLFSQSDRPLFQKLEFYREQRAG